MKRLSFLPVFFAGLGVVFGAAVWVRVASYDGQPAELQQAELKDGRPQERRVLSDGTTPVGAEGTVETFPDDGGSPQRVRALSAREQRYRELLRSAPPPAAVPVKEPSLLDRVVTPLANALGMNRAKPQTPQPAQPRAPQQPQQQPGSGRGDQPGDRNADANQKRDPQEDDPDTDVTPPTLASAEFIPSQVHDGEETTLSVIVNDNLSGVRGVSGVIASPSGSLQGFSCRNEGGRYIARIAVPKDAPEGMWQVKYLTLSDNASNSINLNQAQGALPQSAQFRVVSSGSDSTGPTLKSAWIERISMHAGERNNVFVQADDDKSGVAQVSGVFLSPSKTARIGFGCRPGASGTWECPVSPPSCLDCGLWSLEQIQMQDKANNMSTVRMDNQIVSQIKLDITSESCDSAPPTIQSIVLNPPVISNIDGGKIRVEAILADDGCGVASLSGQAIPPGGIGGQRAYFSFEPSPDGRTFIGTIDIAKHSAKGVWTIAWLQALDKGHNLRAYQTNDPVISRVTFRVE